MIIIDLRASMNKALEKCDFPTPAQIFDGAADVAKKAGEAVMDTADKVVHTEMYSKIAERTLLPDTENIDKIASNVKSGNYLGAVMETAKMGIDESLNFATNGAHKKISAGIKSIANTEQGKVVLDVVQNVLDVAGMIPAFGAIPDLANAYLYYAKGDMVQAGISMACAIPGIGDIGKGGEMLAKLATKGSNVAEVMMKIGKVLMDPKALMLMLKNLDKFLKELLELLFKEKLGKMLVGAKKNLPDLLKNMDTLPQKALSVVGSVVGKLRKSCKVATTKIKVKMLNIETVIAQKVKAFDDSAMYAAKKAKDIWDNARGVIQNATDNLFRNKLVPQLAVGFNLDTTKAIVKYGNNKALEQIGNTAYKGILKSIGNGLDGQMVKSADEVAAGVSKLDDVGTPPRYGERQISDEEYSVLRDQTPTQEIRDQVKLGHDKKAITQDEVLPGKTFIGSYEADHIVAMDKTTKMDGFGKLTKEQQLEVLNNPDNFIGLSKSANTSKQSKSYEEWTHYKKGKNGEIEVNPEFRTKMIEKEKALERMLQKQIDDFIINK